MLSKSAGQEGIWRSFASAIGAELREGRSITGASGLDHQMQAIAVDEKGRRVILVSSEASPRIASLIQVDVQATLPEIRVLVARPTIIDLGVLARRILSPLGSPRVPAALVFDWLHENQALPEDERQERMRALWGDAFAPIARTWKNIEIPTFSQIMDVVNQASYLDWHSIGEELRTDSTDREIDLTSLFNIDNTAIDRRFGVCPLPLYEFSDEDWELFLNGAKVDAVRDRLVELNILQYFFPSPDQLALGLIDQGLKSERAVVGAVESAPDLGHPLSATELVKLSQITDVVKELKEIGYVVEGELGYEVSDKGTSIRTAMKLRPREGVVSKVLSRFSLSISASPKDFLPPH